VRASGKIAAVADDQLHDDLRALHERLRSETLREHGRMNPFAEDLFDWKERGRAWTKDDRGVTIYNSTTVVGDVTIGEQTWIGPFCSLDGTGGLTLGHHCMVSLGCQLLSHDTARWALSGGKADYEYAATEIGDCCFLGTLAVVTKGVTVGHHSLVGAGAVVTGDVEPYSIVAGVPARRIGSVATGDDGSVSLRYD
jgi:acetyltransferase-like isoleucine patch superfamily enzyme